MDGINGIAVFEGNRKNTVVIPEDEKNGMSFFSYDEYTSIIDKADDYYKTVYLLYFETGARYSEGAAIKYSDIDFKQNTVKIRTLKRRKTIFRVLPISVTLKAQLLQHRITAGLSENDFVLAKSHNSKVPTQQAFDRKLKYDCLQHNIDRSKAHMHTWRHTRSIQLLESGTNLLYLRDFLGHAKLSSALVYLQFCNIHVIEAVKSANRNIGLI